MKLDLNITTLWTAVAGTVAAVVFMFNTFAFAADVEALQLDIWYGQYYDRLDDYEEELSQGDTQSAEDLLEQLERLIAKICKADPHWRHCAQD